MRDADLRGVCKELGIPGFADVHVHFMPERVLRKVWAYFDALDVLEWPIEYRLDESARLEQLASLGVVRHTALLYPHKPAMAAWLNEWGLSFAKDAPNCVPTGTFFPEPGAADYVRAGLENGLRAFKAHVQVGAYDPRDPLLDDVWGLLADAGVPVVCHCGSGPMPGKFTGPGPIGEVLARHPSLTLVVAHLGQPEYAEFLALADAYPNVHLDTTMTFTDFVERLAPFPPSLKPRLRDSFDRIVLGSDFPNIPYPYAHQIESLVRLDLGDDWLRAVLHDNGERLLSPAS
ncbi:amidohydrolase family protein [Cryptosporangium sp. NPDC048952]|uniref:amidohydrolase family protein n=1 Tax=Cryptosporangium sp. NPDC048952 TaxID=3363961 RepID=UPI00371D29D6